MLLAPLTALPIAALLAPAVLAVGAGAPPLLLASLVVAAGALYSRGMHLDGLADTADGLSAGYDAQSSLRAMKASDVGPSGVAAVVLALVLQAAALSALLPSASGAAVAALGWLASRQSLAWACRAGVPAAQPQGLGALVAGTVGARGLAVSTGLLAAATLAVTATGPAGDLQGGVPGGLSGGAVWWGPPAAVVAGLLTAALLRHRCRRRLGGITGDTLGAGIEVSLTASLVVAALVATTVG
jgi:adenosylcobinamide-GDP ribazoletransferase